MKKCLNISIIILIVFIFIFSGTAYAVGGGDGSGSGGGNGDGSGGGNSPELVQSSVYDGQTDVSVGIVIELVFSNNVVHFSVAENNKNAFTLLDSNNTAVPIEVIMGDDQIDPSIRRDISIAPSVPLEYGMRYTLIIQKSLSAKNGSTMAADTTLSFTTESNPARGETAQAQDTPESERENLAARDADERTVSNDMGDNVESSENPERRKPQVTTMTFVVIVAAAGIVIFAVFYFRKK